MRGAPKRAKITRTIALRLVVIVDLVLPSILEFAHLILGGLFACMAAGAATGFFRSWSPIARCAFWHFLGAAQCYCGVEEPSGQNYVKL